MQKSIVDADETFRDEIQRRLGKRGRISRAAIEIGINRSCLVQLIKQGTVRKYTLEAIVKKFVSEDANVDHYIKKL